MQIKARQIINVEVDEKDIAPVLLHKAWSLCHRPDDGGCDWYTDDKGNTYITADKDWQVSSNPIVATLIDAYNILLGGAPLKISDLVSSE